MDTNPEYKGVSMRAKIRITSYHIFFLCLILTAGLVPVVGPTLSYGQEVGFPSKPIEIVVPFAPGGSLDLGARVLTETLSRELKVPVIIKNQAGAGGLLGATSFFNAKPDGYTLLAASPSAIISTVQLSKNPTFDPRKDFLPLGMVGIAPISMTVHSNSPFKTFDDFVQFAKKNPGKLRGSFSSPGGETHIMLLSIMKETKIESKVIPYTTGGENIAALLGGHVDWRCASLVSSIPYLKSGDMRTLLLTHRSPEAPGVPSGSDIGLDSVSVDVWLGLFVHGKTPKPVYDRLVSAVKATLNDAKVKAALTKEGYITDYKAPPEFSKIINKDWGVFSEVLKDAGLKTN
jgi:tripartite-type tricarboxylate transporter receptor subunit TctC